MSSPTALEQFVGFTTDSGTPSISLIIFKSVAFLFLMSWGLSLYISVLIGVALNDVSYTT